MIVVKSYKYVNITIMNHNSPKIYKNKQTYINKFM
jgi:hypothetical protein